MYQITKTKSSKESSSVVEDESAKVPQCTSLDPWCRQELEDKDQGFFSQNSEIQPVFDKFFCI